jgi:starvation-inducible DNA-binding protein
MAPLQTPTGPGSQATKDLTAALNLLLADFFALYLKTKNFHWHVSGPHFRDYHLLLDEQADQLYATTDPIAERVRKLGGVTLRSIGQIHRQQRVLDNDADYVTPLDMLAELREDNQQLASRLRETHVVCDEHNDGNGGSRSGSTRRSGASGSSTSRPARANSERTGDSGRRAVAPACGGASGVGRPGDGTAPSTDRVRES